mgnify:FL=1
MALEDPLEDNNEIISAINREGIFFRKAVMDKFSKLKWKCSPEYPYSLQEFTTDRNISKSADIFASRRFGRPDFVDLNFIIECKKSYAPKSKWLFFKINENKIRAWNFHFPCETVLLDCMGNLTNKAVDVCYDQTVLKPAKKNSKTGEKLQQANLHTSGTQIYQASAEVAHALYGIKNEKDKQYSEVDNEIWRDVFSFFKNRWFVPIVITNAELNVSEFEITEDTLLKGTIKNKDFKLKPVPWLIFEYPLPNYLQLPEDDKDSSFPFNFDNYIRKLPIIYLNSSKIEDFLQLIYQSTAPYLYSTGRIK